MKLLRRYVTLSISFFLLLVFGSVMPALGKAKERGLNWALDI